MLTAHLNIGKVSRSNVVFFSITKTPQKPHCLLMDEWIFKNVLVWHFLTNVGKYMDMTALKTNQRLRRFKIFVNKLSPL